MGEAYGFRHHCSHEQMTRTHVGNSPKRHLVPYLYTGKYETNLTGMVQMDARWYQPKLGRWLQPDYYNFAQLSLPNGARQQLLASTRLNTQGLLRDPAQQMRYGYVSGNPLRWLDPFGLIKVKTGQNGAAVADLDEEITRIYPILDDVYEDEGFSESVITSGTDSHEDKPDSLHNDGLAIDLRGNDKTEAENTRLASEISSRLEESYGDDIYDVIFEDYDGANDVRDHIHIEFDPKFPPALRQDMDAVKGDAYGYCPKN